MTNLTTLHEQALAQLTDEWQPFSELDGEWIAFDDLWLMDEIECKIDHSIENSRVCGVRHYYRKVQS